MWKMFENCYLLKKLDIKKFNTENVDDMGDMFRGCKSLEEINISNFSTKNVRNM